MKHPNEEELTLYYYGDEAGPAPAALAEHLALCEECRTLYRKLEAVLRAADVLDSPVPGEGFEAEIWRRLAPRLKSVPPEPLWQRFFAAFAGSRLWAPLGAAAGVAVLIAGAFLAGRFWPRPPRFQREAQVQPTSAGSRERILLLAVGDHLERSQMVLVELANTRSRATVDISAERQLAQELVPPNRLYRLTAEHVGETGVASLLDELERTLIEIAHSPSTLSSPEFEDLRHRIEAQGILFKVRVVDLQVRQRERKTIEDLARRGS